jgi:diguanylate cyclase
VYDEENDVGLLKCVLPLMSKHAAGYHPISYAVWYEYAKGAKPALKEGVDVELMQHGRLTPDTTYALYARHLVEAAEQALVTARTGLMELVEKVQHAVGQVDRDAVGFDRHLKAFKQELTTATAIEDLGGHVSAMLEQSERMSAGVGRLSGELQGSRAEVARLTHELQQMREEALTDALSGLLNRKGLALEMDRLSTRLKAGDAKLGGQVSVIMFDIDHFKNINDTYGHPLGDRVIAAVSRSILECVARFGVAARYGGEEFAVLLPGQPVRFAEELAQTIRQRIEQGRIRRRQGEEPIGGVTISAGVAAWHGGGSLADALERADRALYASKKAGRNRITVEHA